MTTLTLSAAKNLRSGTTLCHKTQTQAGGKSAQRWRVNGKPKTWKTMPERVEVPLKHGLYAYGYLNERNLRDFYVC